MDQNDRNSRRPGQSNRIIGIRTYESYVSSMVDLWKQQRHAGINNESSPRDAYVSAFLENKAKQSSEISVRNHDDRGTGTLLDGYSTLSDLAKIIEAGFALHNTTKGLAASAAFAFSHASLLRGDNVRKMDLANLFCVTLDDESIDSNNPCWAMVATMIRSKTNDEGLAYKK
jgi:hypothetical protein